MGGRRRKHHWADRVPPREHRVFPESTPTAEIRKTTPAGAAFPFPKNLYRQGVAVSAAPFDSARFRRRRTTNKKTARRRSVCRFQIRPQRSVLRGDNRRTLQASTGGLDLRLACALAASPCLRSGCAVLCDIQPDDRTRDATQHRLFGGFDNLRRSKKNSHNK